MIKIKSNKNTNMNSNQTNKMNNKIVIGIVLLLTVILVIGLLIYFDNRYVTDNNLGSNNEEISEEEEPVYLGDVYTFPNPDLPFNNDSVEESTRKFLVTEYFMFHGNEILEDFPNIANIENEMSPFETHYSTLHDETGLVGYVLWTIEDGNSGIEYLKFVKKDNPYVLEMVSPKDRVLHHMEVDISGKGNNMEVSSIRELSDEEFKAVEAKQKSDEYVSGNLLKIGDESLKNIEEVRKGIREALGYNTEEDILYSEN